MSEAPAVLHEVVADGALLPEGIRYLVLAGGFTHENPALIGSIAAMATLFGVTVTVAPHPGFAGAVGAALMACKQEQST